LAYFSCLLEYLGVTLLNRFFPTLVTALRKKETPPQGQGFSQSKD
jgi:hypothetical protein